MAESRTHIHTYLYDVRAVRGAHKVEGQVVCARKLEVLLRDLQAEQKGSARKRPRQSGHTHVIVDINFVRHKDARDLLSRLPQFLKPTAAATIKDIRSLLHLALGRTLRTAHEDARAARASCTRTTASDVGMSVCVSRQTPKCKRSRDGNRRGAFC